MAQLDIVESPDAMTTVYQHFPAMRFDDKCTIQNIAIGGAHAESNAFQGTTQVIQISVDATCRYAIGPNPVADGNSPRLAAGQIIYHAVSRGHKLSVISSS